MVWPVVLISLATGCGLYYMLGRFEVKLPSLDGIETFHDSIQMRRSTDASFDVIGSFLGQSLKTLPILPAGQVSLSVACENREYLF